MASAKRRRQRRNRHVEEAAAVVEAVRGDLVPVVESGLRTDGTAALRLISPGWGSSGFYSAEVLEAAADDRVFPAGTHMYLDHPTVSERGERPERSIRDLAAVLETDGVWQANHPEGPGIYAQARIFTPYQPVIAEMASHIGVSIRASAEVSRGEADGRRGPIVERLIDAPSVDFVTRPGRGGQVLTILESARLGEAMADDVRQWLRAALQDRFETGDGRYLWVRDYDPDEGAVIFDLEGDGVENPGTFRLAYTLADEQVALSSNEPTEVRVTTSYQPIDPPAPSGSPVTEAKEAPMTPEDKQEIATMIAEAVKPLNEKVEEATKAPEPPEETSEVEEAVTRAERAEERLLVREASDHVAGLDKVKALPAVTAARLVESVAKGAQRTDDGKLDVKALTEAAETAVEAEVKYLTEATGSSPVRNLGGPTDPVPASEVTEARLTSVFADAFGLSDDAAKVAANGRR